MPDDATGFFGRGLPEVEDLYPAALSDLSRETYLAFRDARTAPNRRKVEEFLGSGDLARAAIGSVA